MKLYLLTYLLHESEPWYRRRGTARRCTLHGTSRHKNQQRLTNVTRLQFVLNVLYRLLHLEFPE